MRETPSDYHYDAERARAMDLSYSIDKHLAERAELDFVSLGGPGFGLGQARDPLFQGSAVALLGGGALLASAGSLPVFGGSFEGTLALKLEVNAVSGASDFMSQMYSNNGDIRNWNVLSTLGAIGTGNPLFASFPGGVVNFSFKALSTGSLDSILKNPFEPQNMKSILLNTVGNKLGDKSERLFLKNLQTSGLSNAGTRVSAEFLGQQTGDVLSSIIDK